MVKATMERSEEKENLRILRVEVEPEKVEQHLNQAFSEIRRDLALPGFRKGRVPRKIFESRFGVAPIWEEALEKMVPEAYGEAIEQLELQPIAPPDVELESGGPDEDSVVFTAEVEVMPEVNLGPYKDLGLEFEVPEITDEDVDEAIEDLRERRATAELVEDEDAEVAPGMLAVVGFQGYLDDEPREELQAEEEMLDIGSGQYLPGFEEGILGAKVGETREVQVEIPADAPSQDLAGQEVTFEVEIKELKQKRLPDLDDDFAKEVGDAESVDALREQVREYLEDARMSSALREFEQQVIDKVAENTELEIPQPMIDDLVERRVEEMQREAEQRGMEFPDYLAARGMGSEEEARSNFREQAGPDLKESLILDAVAEAEGVEVTEEEFEAELENRAEAMGADPAVLRQMAMATEFGQRLRSDLRIQKTRRLLAGWSDEQYTETLERLEESRRVRREKAKEKAEAAEAETEAAQDDAQNGGEPEAEEPEDEA